MWIPQSQKYQTAGHEITNLVFLTLHLNLPQDQKVKTEKVMNFSFVVAGEKKKGKKDVMDFYTHLKDLLNP